MSSDSGLCKYRNALGVPRTGAHSIRIGNIAIVDVVLTLVGAYIIAYFARTSFAWTAAGLFLAGIILHRLFCVRTTIDKLLFPLFPMFPNTK
jgi:fatty acid desaturase